MGTNLSTEEYNIHSAPYPASQLQVSDHQNYKEHSYFNTQIQIDQPKLSTFPRQRHPDSKPPPPYPQEQPEYRIPEEDYKYDMRTPPSYKPPPITHRPPHPSHQPPAGKEDIK